MLILAWLLGMGDWRARTELLKISLSMRAGGQQVLCWTRIVGHLDGHRDQHRLLWRVLTGDWYAGDASWEMGKVAASSWGNGFCPRNRSG